MRDGFRACHACGLRRILIEFSAPDDANAVLAPIRLFHIGQRLLFSPRLVCVLGRGLAYLRKISRLKIRSLLWQFVALWFR
jgi:hypothetical protein